MPKRVLEAVSKNGFTSLKLEHILVFIVGVVLFFYRDGYHHISAVAQVMVLIVYLGSLVAIAPVPLPTFKRKRTQIMFAGLLSGVLDSFIVLLQLLRLRTAEPDEYGNRTERTEVSGNRAKFFAIATIAALTGGLIIWFGEVYAAGLFINDGRTGLLSALFIVPPALVFLWILGTFAERLDIDVLPNEGKAFSKRDLGEFIAGIALLLLTHNPMLCLAALLVYVVLTSQADHLIEQTKHHTEVNVMLVLLVALIAGGWVVSSVIEPMGLGQGEFLPIIPAGVQAVLWGPLYTDATVHFWIRIATLSTGALLLPISSLVGVMLFSTMRQWLVYMKYSFIFAAVWYGLLRLWIWVAFETPIGEILEQWAHSGGGGH